MQISYKGKTTPVGDARLCGGVTEAMVVMMIIIIIIIIIVITIIIIVITIIIIRRNPNENTKTRGYLGITHTHTHTHTNSQCNLAAKGGSICRCFRALYGKRGPGRDRLMYCVLQLSDWQ